MTERGGRSESETARALITSDEVRRLSPLEMLAIIGEMQPLRLQQRRWYQDSQVKGRVTTPDPKASGRATPLTPPDADRDLAAARTATPEDAELDWERAVAAAAQPSGSSGAAEPGTEATSAAPGSAAGTAAQPGPVEPDLISH